MTLNEVIGKVMVILDEARSFNPISDIEDYKYRIYEVIDSVQREIATLCTPIYKSSVVRSENNVLKLDDEVYEVTAVTDTEQNRVSFIDIKNGSLIIPDGEYTLAYFAYPKKISYNTSPEEPLEIPKEALEALVYGVCAGLCINDEPELYRVYMSRYTTYLNNLLNRKESKPKASISGGIRI